MDSRDEGGGVLNPPGTSLITAIRLNEVAAQPPSCLNLYHQLQCRAIRWEQLENRHISRGYNF